jgi:hypothetical protein
MRFYEWASSSEGNSGIRELHIKGWADDFELSWRLQEAQPFGEGEWIQEAPAEWDEEGPLTDMPFNPNFHLVSPRLRALLEELGLGAEIQFLPVRVVGEKSGREVGVYYVAHFLRRISCLDLEHSVGVEFYEPDYFRPEKRGKIRAVWRAVLRREAIGEARVFRVDEYVYIVVIREDVKAAMEAAGITGCWFQELEVV